MQLRVTDLLIEAAKGAVDKKTRKRRGKPKAPKGGWPKTCLPHTSPRCRTCSTITFVSRQFTGNNICLSSFDESEVRAELLAQLRAMLNAPRRDEKALETAA